MTQGNFTTKNPPGIEEIKREWEAPEPLNSPDNSLPYPLEGLPKEIREAVEEVQSFTQAPPAMVACCALSALSLAGQGLADVRRDEGLEGPISLYVVLLAESGERKTSVDGYFTAPLRQKELAEKERSAPVVKEYMAAHAAWVSKKAGILSKISTLSKGGKPTLEEEQRLADIEKDEPEAPLVLRLLYQDATPEALAWGLSHYWPSGGVISAEAGTVLGGHAMGKDSIVRNLALINQLWDGTPVHIDRRTAPSYILQGTRLTMGLATQPETLTEFFEQSKGLARGTGFMARFLMCWPESTQGTRFYREAPTSWAALTRFQNRLIDILSETPEPDREKGLTPQMMTFTGDGKIAWVEAYNEIESDLGDGGDLRELRDVASKAADNIARLSALFALYGGEEQVHKEDINGATEIVAWHLHESRRIFRTLGADPVKLLAGKLDAWLLAQGKPELPKSEIQKSGPNPLRKKDPLDLALKVLTTLNRIRVKKSGHKETVIINPGLLEGGK